MRRTVLSSTLRAALAALALAGAAAGQTPADTGFTAVQVDLGNRTFGQVLPFDVPFQLTGDVPAGVERVEVEFTRARLAEVAPPPPPPDLDQQCAERGADDPRGGDEWLPDPPARWTREGLVDTGEAVEFLVTLPALDAQRYYVFRFRLLRDPTADQVKVYQQRAAQVLDERLRTVVSGNLTAEESKRLRLDLIAALKEMVGEGDLIAPGTLFDPCTPAEQVRREFGLDFVRIYIEQGFRQRQGPESMRPWPPVLAGQLRALRADSAFNAAAANVQAAARQSPAHASLASGPGASSLARLAADDPDARGAGTAPEAIADAAAVWTTWSADVMDGFAANWQKTWQELLALQGWIRTAVGEAEALGLSAAELAALQAAVAPGGVVAKAIDAADSLQSTAGLLRDSLRQRWSAIQELASKYQQVAANHLLVDASTLGNADTFQASYVSADLGFVYLPDISESVPYAGTNIYFRPINKDAPLSVRGGFARRFALTLGVTLASLADERQTRQDFAGSQSLLVGAGLRVTESIRLGLGAVAFIKEDPNPLVEDDTTGVTPYVSVSFDWNVAKAFKGIGGKFFGDVQ